MSLPVETLGTLEAIKPIDAIQAVVTPPDQLSSGRFELRQRFFFDAAHTLTRTVGAPEAAASRRVHGHTYHAELILCGTPNPATGMIVDLGVVRQHIAQLRDSLDHHLLNEVPGLGCPTLENLCLYVWQQSIAALPALSGVKVWREGMGDSCTYYAP